jgi:hypothetical protein
LVPVAEITVDRQVQVIKNVAGKPEVAGRHRSTHDGFATIQTALDWAAERPPENLDVMFYKNGELHLIRDSYQAHSRKSGAQTVATIRLRSLVTQVLATAPVADANDAAAGMAPVAQRRRHSP